MMEGNEQRHDWMLASSLLVGESKRGGANTPAPATQHKQLVHDKAVAWRRLLKVLVRSRAWHLAACGKQGGSHERPPMMLLRCLPSHMGWEVESQARRDTFASLISHACFFMPLTKERHDWTCILSVDLKIRASLMCTSTV